MAIPTFHSVRVLAGSSTKTLRTVNIKTVATGANKQHTQQTTNGPWPQVQDSGGQIKGLPTIVISGYSGPA